MTGLAMRSRGHLRIGIAALALAGCRGDFPMPSADTFSTWSRTPLVADPAMAKLATEHSACRAGFPADAPVTIVIQDRRTTSTAAFLLTAPGHFGSCIISAGGSGGGGSTNVVPALTGVITVDEQGTGTSGEGSTNTLGGLAAPNVTTVKVTLRDATEVIASVENGYWLSWWPGGEPAQLVTAISSDGVILAVLDRQGDSWVVRGTAP
jgi:hypothetical protein